MRGEEALGTCNSVISKTVVRSGFEHDAVGWLARTAAAAGCEWYGLTVITRLFRELAFVNTFRPLKKKKKKENDKFGLATSKL